MPNIAMPTATLASTPSTTVRDWKRCSGISGSFTRRTTSTEATASSTPPGTSTAVCQPSHANWWPASVTQISSDETDAPIQQRADDIDRQPGAWGGRGVQRALEGDHARIANGTPM